MTLPPLTPEQHRLVADVLRQAAALELALGNPQAAGLWLTEFIAETREARPPPRREERAA